MLSCMLYNFELVILGVLLLGTMLVCGVVLWWRRRRDDESNSMGTMITDDTTKR